MGLALDLTKFFACVDNFLVSDASTASTRNCRAGPDNLLKLEAKQRRA
jgi:hypothetical protein